MKTPTAPYTVLGEEPNVLGQILTSLLLQHSYQNGQITDHVNAAYLKFQDQWFQLCFEPAMIFWRPSEAPALPENSDLSSGLLLNDLSAMSAVVGQTLESLEYEASMAGDVQAGLRFANGKHLQFLYTARSEERRVGKECRL